MVEIRHQRRWVAVAVLICAAAASAEDASDEPGLPPGLETESEEPPPPAGIDDDGDGPELPPGLDDGAGPAGEDRPDEPWLPAHVSGFLDLRGGTRTQDDPFEKKESIGEARLQLRAEHAWDAAAIRVSGDILYDRVIDEHDVDLERGEGMVDLREASLLLRPLSFLDVKIGRQVLTWGTGDLVFVNDLFPKDWNAFLIGRDTEYLKAPSDAMKLSLFGSALNLDLVYTPRFDSDRYIDGSRLSFFNPQLGRLSGRDALVTTDLPDDWIRDHEFALRIYKTVAGYELAAYAYRGHWKSPAGFSLATGNATFPDLAVYGASVRGSVGPGIGHVELGFYNSEEDEDGDDPLIRNGEARVLVGYELDPVKNMTLGIQYYLEQLTDYDEYRRGLLPGAPVSDRSRHVFTLRITRLMFRQNLRLSLFTFYSPSDHDAYLRPHAHFKLNDAWAAELGGNLFVGDKDHTFFGQFQDNSNVYAAARYSF